MTGSTGLQRQLVLPEISEFFNNDPSNIKKFNKLYKSYRDFAETAIKFLEKYYSDEIATKKLSHFLLLLTKCPMGVYVKTNNNMIILLYE